MKKFVYTLLLTGIACFLHAQLNTTLLSNLKYPVRLNDVWGWVAPDSTEYALVGLLNGVSIVSLADPKNPEEVAFVPGGNSTWRDLKTWGNYAYVTTDQGGTREGLLTIDLSQLPDTVTYTKWTPTIDNRTLYTCHNLYIDENGIAYLSGCNVNGGGILFVDVATTPGTPVLIGKGVSIYSHDVYTRNDTLYTSEIYEGNVGFYDIKDKNNPISLAKQQTPFRFTHNTWLSDNGKTVFTTDEQPNAPIGAYDISDLDNIIELDQFRPAKSLGSGVIPHNVHVKDDYLLISYYTDGGVIVDAARPGNLIEVANYDTYTPANTGFNGAWGLYPFLPSGNILISDINTGLWVVKPDLKRACYLEGVVTDSVTRQSLPEVEVVIQSAQLNQERTDLSGIFKTGQVLSGTFQVTFSKNGYYSKTVQVNLQNGILTTLNVELTPWETYNVTGKALSQTGNIGVAGAKIWIVNDSLSYTGTADADGNFSFSQIRQANYDIYVGAWGYRYKLEENVFIDNNKTITLTLTSGYEDNFTLDLGWETFFRDATGGWWVRAIPVGTASQGATANPAQDLSDDIGDFCYVTGNDGSNASSGDVDGGPVTLVSPVMDLTTYNKPILTYHLWFFNAGGGDTSAPNDSLVVRLTNGIDTVTVEKVTDSQSFWRAKSSIQARDFLTITNNMKLIFETSDIGAESHIVEAAVDGFSVEEGSATPVEEPFSLAFQLQAFPNPFNDQLTVRFQMPAGVFQGTIRLLNALGQVVEIYAVHADAELLTLEAPAAGIYWLQVVSADGKVSEVIKVIKI